MDTTVLAGQGIQKGVPDNSTYMPEHGGGLVGLHEIFALILARKVFILVVMSVSMVLLAVAVMSMRNTYTATAVLVLERNDGKLLEAVTQVVGEERDRSAVETEMDVISSRHMVGSVVDAMDLIDHPWFNTYLPSTEGDGLKRLVGAAKSKVKAIFGIDDAVRPRLPSRSVQRDQAITSLLSRMKVSRDDESLAITIRVGTPDPELSAAIANTIVNVYVDWTRELKKQTMSDAVAFLRERAMQIAARIAQSERSITDFSQTNQLAPDARDDLVRQRVDSMNEQLTTARVELAGIRARREQGERVIEGTETLEGSALSSPLLTSLKSEKSALVRQRAQYATNLGGNHPDVRKADAEIVSVNGMIGDELKQIVEDLSGEERVANNRVQQLQTQIKALQETVRQRSLAEIRLRELQRDLLADQNLHDVLVARLGGLDPFTEIAKASARAVSIAAVPTQPSFPQRGRIFVGGVVGATVLAIVLALMLEASDTRIRSGQRISELVQLRNLASLPAYSRSWFVRPPTEPSSFLRQQRTVYTEAFRALYLGCRAQLTGAQSVILLTAPLPRDGTAEVALGLACSAAADGVRTLYLDLAPQDGSEAERDGSGAPVGYLEDFFAGDCDLAAALRPVHELGELSVLQSRRLLDPFARSICFEQMRQLIEQLRTSHDLVVVNCAPVLLVEDANWLSPLVDAVVLVARFRRTRAQELVGAISRLRVNHAPLIGTVLSRVDHRARMFRETIGGVSYRREAMGYLAR